MACLSTQGSIVIKTHPGRSRRALAPSSAWAIGVTNGFCQFPIGQSLGVLNMAMAVSPMHIHSGLPPSPYTGKFLVKGTQDSQALTDSHSLWDSQLRSCASVSSLCTWAPTSERRENILRQVTVLLPKAVLSCFPANSYPSKFPPSLPVKYYAFFQIISLLRWLHSGLKLIPLKTQRL